jgi:hypothetical protein
MSNHTTFLETYLARFTESDWLNAVEALVPSIHEVERRADMVSVLPAEPKIGDRRR